MKSNSFILKNLAIFDCPCTDYYHCPLRMYNYSIDSIKTIIGVKPKVGQDIIAIFEKFPCNEITSRVLGMFVSKKYCLITTAKKYFKTNFLLFRWNF